MAKITNRQHTALRALTLDLFMPEVITPPAPATIHTRIQQEAERIKKRKWPVSESSGEVGNRLPAIPELYQLFDRFNWSFFGGELPSARIEYSSRMWSAGSFTTSEKLIRIGRRYHEIFPEELEDTLKHEMIHILHPGHDSAFKAEAKRIGATLRARSHPSLRRPPRYIYECLNCNREYPRQKRLRMASCGSCSRGGRFEARYKLKLKWSATIAR